LQRRTKGSKRNEYGFEHLNDYQLKNYSLIKPTRQDSQTKTCPYCGGKMLLKRTDKVIKEGDRIIDHFYCCENSPECTCTALAIMDNLGNFSYWGLPANNDLKFLRKETHFYIDQIVQNNVMQRTDVYQYIARVLGVPVKMAHARYFDIGNCRMAITAAIKLLHDSPRFKGKRFIQFAHGWAQKQPELTEILRDLKMVKTEKIEPVLTESTKGNKIVGMWQCGKCGCALCVKGLEYDIVKKCPECGTSNDFSKILIARTRE